MSNQKICTTCKIEKSLDLYSPDKRATDGKQSRCRECSKKLQSKKYHSDIELSRSKNRDYYDENKEYFHEKSKIYRDNNVEIIKERKKKYYDSIKTDEKWKENN